MQTEADVMLAVRERAGRVFRRIKDLKPLKKLQQEFLLILVQLVDEQQFQEGKETF